MKLTELKTGTKLQLEIDDNSGEIFMPTFASEFESMEDDGHMIIAAPIFEGVLYPVRVGSEIFVYVFHSPVNMAGVDMYRFKALVVDRVSNDGLAFLKIKFMGQLEKIQRRQYFRVKCFMPAQYKEALPKQQAGDTNQEIGYKKAIVRDISGGGLCLSVDENIKKDKILEFILFLENGKELFFKGKVVRVSDVFDNQTSKYEIGISFDSIEDKDREEIIRYIFTEQRNLRRRGLI